MWELSQTKLITVLIHWLLLVPALSPSSWQWYFFDSCFLTWCTILLSRNMLKTGCAFPPTECRLLNCWGLKETLKTDIIFSFFITKINYKTLVWSWINNSMCIKNTFSFFFQCVTERSHSWPWRLLSCSKQFVFGSWGVKHNPRVSFWNVPRTQTFQWHLQLEAWLERHSTKASGSHQKLGVLSSSFSFCLAAGKANLWASCCSIHILLILFNHSAKVNNHSYVTFERVEVSISTTLLLELIRTPVKPEAFCCFCSKFCSSLRKQLPESLMQSSMADN